MGVCKCDCGKEIDVPITNLKNGFKKSCGCWYKQHLFSKDKSDHHIGKKYHHFKVLKSLGLRPNGKQHITFFLCKCDCGQKFEVSTRRIGIITSCGCKRKDRGKIDYEKAEEIRKMFSFGYKICQLAKMHKLSYFNIRDIINRRSYTSPIKRYRTPKSHPASASEPCVNTNSSNGDTQKPYQAALYSAGILL
jgi:hypothetical protein